MPFAKIGIAAGSLKKLLIGILFLETYFTKSYARGTILSSHSSLS